MMTRTAPDSVKKRDGSIVPFDASKIEHALRRAALDVLDREDRADEIARRVTGPRAWSDLARSYQGKIPGVEDIQDAVEAALMEEGYGAIAKSYILYRENRSQVRFAKSALGLTDDLKLPVNAVEVLKRRYLLKDDRRQIVETPSELFRRVAHHVAQAEANYRSDLEPGEAEDAFYRMMRNREFLPNSPTLMNAGTGARPTLRLLRSPGGGFRRRHLQDPGRHGPHPPDGRRHRLRFLAPASAGRPRGLDQRSRLRPALVHEHLRQGDGGDRPGRPAPGREHGRPALRSS